MGTNENESCYSLGFRVGVCAAQVMHGLPFSPENYIVLPEKCRDNEGAMAGIKAGMALVYHTIEAIAKTGKVGADDVEKLRNDVKET